MRRSVENELHHRRISDLPGLLSAGDTLLVNDTRVIPARIQGRRTDTGGRVEGLFLAESGASQWKVMLKANGRLRAGCGIELSSAAGRPAGVFLHLTERSGSAWNVRVSCASTATEPDDTGSGPAGTAHHILESVGKAPLPPYILRARADRNDKADTEAEDRLRYQTIFAARAGAVAAPTAGLHFTRELLDRLESAGVDRGSLTLHVGEGTFKPVQAEFIEHHDMHWEWFEVPAATLDLIQRTRKRRGRVIAVGTTTVRCLETLGSPLPGETVSDRTNLLIRPGHRFRHVDGLLTNFHLPRSTLLALVAALIGLDRLHELYRVAIRERYRFYSYGDAMLILP